MTDREKRQCKYCGGVPANAAHHDDQAKIKLEASHARLVKALEECRRFAVIFHNEALQPQHGPYARQMSDKYTPVAQEIAEALAEARALTGEAG